MTSLELIYLASGLVIGLIIKDSTVRSTLFSRKSTAKKERKGPKDLKVGDYFMLWYGIDSYYEWRVNSVWPYIIRATITGDRRAIGIGLCLDWRIQDLEDKNKYFKYIGQKQETNELPNTNNKGQTRESSQPSEENTSGIPDS